MKGILGKYAERGTNKELGFLGFSGFIGFANPEKPKKPINPIYADLHIVLRQLPCITRSICDNCIYFATKLLLSSRSPQGLSRACQCVNLCTKKTKIANAKLFR